MDIFSVIMLAGGLSFFLFGMHVMSTGLERMAGGRLEHALKRMTSNPIKSLALGAGITIAIQSSSALTVMLVGLVNSGIMDIGQTAGIIMGSNIGTTLTAWLLSLVGLETENVWLRLLKPENFSLIFSLVGIILIMMSKKEKHKDIGSVLVGFAVLMYGMKLMSGAVSPLAQMPEFTNLLVAFHNPIIGVLTGAVFTGVIQSSAASVGILQALAMTGSITYGMAIPIIMGQNIGTCVTALISSIGVNRNAKKVAVIHVSFNVIGTVVLLVLYYGLNAIFHFSFTDMPIGAAGIAAVHSIFNVATTALLLPFSRQLVKLANRILPDRKDNARTQALLDARLLATPAFAVSECDAITNDMAALTEDTLRLAMSLSDDYRESAAQTVTENEDKLDRYEDGLGSYLVQISAKQLSDGDSLKVSKMLHAIGDFERLGDHAVNILHSETELRQKGLAFSPAAKAELAVLGDAVSDILSRTFEAYRRNDAARAEQVEPLEQVIDRLVAAIRGRHITRLKKGECSIELGFILSDLLNNYERISDHCSNIAVAVIEISQHSFDTHKYLNARKTASGAFNRTFEEFGRKYALPD